ncbi:MAG: DUF4421 family protein [Bacteroidota bacterium]
MFRRLVTLFIGGALLAIVSNRTAYAQTFSPEYVHDFSDTLNLRVLFVQKGLQMKIQNQLGSQRYFFTPWHRNYVGVGGFLWNIGFSALLPVSPSLGNDDLRRFDFQSSVFGRNWMADGIYQSYHGFVQSSRRFNAPANSDQELENTGLKKIQATITYAPSGEKFSLGFPYNQGHQQRRSSGSLLMSADFSYKNITSDDGILPPGAVSNQDPLKQLRRVESFSFTSMAGYGATLVHRNYYLYLFGLTGLGFQRINYQTDRKNRLFAIEPAYDVRAGLGRDQGDWYIGMYASSDYTVTDVEDWRFIGRTSQVRFFVGVRFSEPRFLRRIKPRFLEEMRSSPSLPLPFVN